MSKKDKTAVVNQLDCLTKGIRLIPEFDGTSQAVVEWLRKLELVCKLRGNTGLQTAASHRRSLLSVLTTNQLGQEVRQEKGSATLGHFYQQVSGLQAVRRKQASGW